MGSRTSGYDGFISYSHALDDALAPALQQGIERFAKRWYRPRALRIFRDTASLSANPGLWRSIERALSSSKWLVLMASPEAAQSPWVNREISWWLENHRSVDRVLIVLTEGELVWDEASGRLDKARTTALPPSLRDALVEEPRWVDLRWLDRVEQVDQANPQFRESIADIAAALHEVPKDEIVGEHIHRHRQTMRVARGAVVGLVVLLVASLLGAGVAWTQRNAARTQRNEARNQARLATSRQLAAQAQMQQSLRPATSLMLSLEALHVADTPEAHASLRDTLLKSPFAKILAGREKPIKEVEFSADGRLVALAGDDETVHVWQVGEVTERQDVATLSGMAVSFGDGRLMATSGGRSPVLWDMAAPARPVRLGQLSSGAAGAVQLGRGPRALVDGAPASLWDVSQPRRPRLLGEVPSGGRDTALSPDGRLLATANRPGRSELWDVGDATRPRLVGSIPVLSDLVVFSPDSSMLAVTSRVDKRDEVAQLWDVRNPRKPRFLTKLRTASNTPAFDVDFAFDGKRAVTANFDGTASVWDIGRPSAPVETTVLRGHTGAAYTADFSPDGRRVVTGSEDGTAIIWNVAPAATVPPLAQIGGFEDVPEVIVFSPDSRRLLVVNGYLDPAAVWNVSRPDKPVRESILTLSRDPPIR
jgi:WD40 repeat protein